MFWIGKLLGLVPGVAGAVASALAKRQDTAQAGIAAERDVSVRGLQSLDEAQRTSAEIRKADRGSLWTAWMLPAGFGLFLLHAAGVVLDSMPLLGHQIGSWGIPPLPGEFATLQFEVLRYSICGVVVLGVARILRRAS